MDLTSFGVDSKKPKEIKDKNLNIDIENIKKEFSVEEKERYLPWFLKYQLKSYEDLILTSDIKKITQFIEDFKPGKALLLYGAPGSGKTTTLNLIGNHFDYEVFELNASDSRNKKAIDATIGDVIKQRSLFNKKKLILVDEVDGVSGLDDRGGVAELSKFVKTSKYPIVFTANDGDSDKIKPLKKVATFINFENQSKELLEGIAVRIFESEKISYDKIELEEFIEERNTTDIRGFINDLQASVCNSEFEPQENLEIRDYKKKIENLLEKIYFSYPEDTYKSTFNTNVPLDDIFLYLEENTPNAYAKAALITAFNEISKADIFKGRIMKWQYWRFLVYVNFYLTFGVSAAKTEPRKTPVKKNSRILKKWIYGNKVNALRPRTKVEKGKDDDYKFIEKLAKLYGTSAKRCRSKDLFYFAMQYRNNSEFAKSMDEKLQIDDATRKAILEL